MLDLSSCQALQPIGVVVADLQASLPDLDFMVVGAWARDLHLVHSHNIREERMTHDLDLAVAVQAWSAFDAATISLTGTGKFKATRSSQRFSHISGYPLDLVPYGGVETPQRELRWPPSGATRMNLIGYSEVRAAATSARLPGDVLVNLPSLAGLLLLKCFAFGDRGTTTPGKDAGDIHLMLRHYIDAGHTERFFSDFERLSEEFDYGNAGAYMAGADVAAVLHDPAARGQLIRLIAEQVDEARVGPMLAQVSAHQRPEFNALLASFGKGLGSR